MDACGAVIGCLRLNECVWKVWQVAISEIVNHWSALSLQLHSWGKSWRVSGQEEGNLRVPDPIPVIPNVLICLTGLNPIVRGTCQPECPALGVERYPKSCRLGDCVIYWTDVIQSEVNGAVQIINRAQNTITCTIILDCVYLRLQTCIKGQCPSCFVMSEKTCRQLCVSRPVRCFVVELFIGWAILTDGFSLRVRKMGLEVLKHDRRVYVDSIFHVVKRLKRLIQMWARAVAVEVDIKLHLSSHGSTAELRPDRERLHRAFRTLTIHAMIVEVDSNFAFVVSAYWHVVSDISHSPIYITFLVASLKFAYVPIRISTHVDVNVVTHAIIVSARLIQDCHLELWRRRRRLQTDRVTIKVIITTSHSQPRRNCK